MASVGFNSKQIEEFQHNGYLMVRSLFDREEMDSLRQSSRRDKALKEKSYSRTDSQGASVTLALWNEAGDDIYGLVGRSERIVDRVEQLLGSEVYHWHSKMIEKEPYTGGAWEWHQDYGYWYYDGCLFPELMSVMIAVDPATQENGCLQVLKGSHRIGRIDHGKTGDQKGADLERVEAAQKTLELVPCEMQPGDALFFHCNLLHRSDQNRSSHPRWALICCYNAVHNSPYKESRHPTYSPLEKVPDEVIKQAVARLPQDVSEVRQTQQR
ncbi:MAG: phytanoyl-CoA dioxygenase family protein [Terriglobia bacterium]